MYAISGHMISHVDHMTHLLEEPRGKGMSKLPIFQKQKSPEGSKVSADAAIREEVLH